MVFNEIKSLAQRHGVAVRGGFSTQKADDIPQKTPGEATLSLVLFGQVGPSLWSAFEDSPELTDGKSNPMDRWSERVGNTIAREMNGLALFPFGGPPHHPFQQWAVRAESVSPSRLGISIHTQYGLWHAYRFAVALPTKVIGLDPESSKMPVCDSCVGHPCLSKCPVGAFGDDGYDVTICFNYLNENLEAPCHSIGCLARDACPEGQEFRYGEEQIRFHMHQFYQSLLLNRQQ